MNRTAFLTLLATLVLALLLPSEAQAMYHPRLGRFLQRDPEGHVDGLSLYCYADSTPTSHVDPLGRWRINVDKDCDCPCPQGQPPTGRDLRKKDIENLAEWACDAVERALNRWDKQVIDPAFKGGTLAWENIKLMMRIKMRLYDMKEKCLSGLSIECETCQGLTGIVNRTLCSDKNSAAWWKPSLFGGDKILLCKCNYEPQRRFITHELSHTVGTVDPYNPWPLQNIDKETAPEDTSFFFESLVEQVGAGTANPWDYFAHPDDITTKKPKSWYRNLP